jgi:pyruvate carboxylase subunit B
MRTEDMLPIAEEMNKAGFYSMEVWGGATFDVACRFLNEDPWDRPRALKKLMPDTPLQMLLRGQNLVGYRNYADDLVIAFVQHAAECGIDIFRIFDALNDERNLETSCKAVKECGKHAQLSICYSLTEPKMGGLVFTLDYYLEKARILEDMGADSICIKDMAGLIAPDDAYTLVSALKKTVKVPIHLHTHYTSGMGSMSLLKATEAGVDMIDTCVAPFALRTSHPAVEPLIAALRGTPRTNVLVHQTPGGMISNLVTQLRQSNALDRLDEVYAEVPKVRKELGYPPLVTPTSQIVGVQAVQNVLAGRYKLVSTQVMDYCYGLYGRPPAPIDPEVQKMVLKFYKKGQEPITSRPADLLEPELDTARELVKDITDDIGDVITAAIYPITGLRFLKWKGQSQDTGGRAAGRRTLRQGQGWPASREGITAPSALIDRPQSCRRHFGVTL